MLGFWGDFYLCSSTVTPDWNCKINLICELSERTDFNCKCIQLSTPFGKRDWFAQKPYYEFYMHPKIRFEIRPKKRLIDHFIKYWVERYYNEFRSVEESLHEVGLSTFDLG